MRIAAALASLVLAAITALLVALTVARARLPYENGRYFDPIDSVSYDEGAAAVYGLMAMGSALATMVALAVTARLFRKG